MSTVSNTSPISNLAAIGRLKLLQGQFGRVHIPHAVLRELRAHPDQDVRALLASNIEEGWLFPTAVEDSALLRLFRSQLHEGEAEALALAAQLRANIVLLDEREARRLAQLSGFSVTGVLGVLLKAKKLGQITAIEPEIQRLRTSAKFRLSESLVNRVLAEAGE